MTCQDLIHRLTSRSRPSRHTMTRAVAQSPRPRTVSIPRSCSRCAAQRGGQGAYLDLRDGTFQPEPLGPRSAKARAAPAKAKSRACGFKGLNMLRNFSASQPKQRRITR